MPDVGLIFSPMIARSFDKGVHKKLLLRYRVYAEYAKRNIPFHEFVQELIDNGRIEIADLEEFFSQELLYGNQRSIYMYELYGDYRKSQNRQALLSKIQERYTYVDTLKFHSILLQPFKNEITELVSIKVELGMDAMIIPKITLIFGEKCTVRLKDGFHREYSYVTVEVNFGKKQLFIKVEPKTEVQEEAKKPPNLVEKYFNIVTELLKLHYNEFDNTHKVTLCNMNTELYNQVYNKMVQNKPEGIEKYIDDVTEGFLEKFIISNYKEKLAQSSIFNIQDMLAKMAEHILITDILYESAETGTLDGVEGYVTYIKFSDGTNISARIRGEDYISPIFSSEAFMALRASIYNANKIAILKISWLNEYRGTRVSYDATDNMCLKILLYKRHTKEEFDYAIRKFKECESRTNEKDTAILAMENRDAAVAN